MDALGLIILAGLALYLFAPSVFANILPPSGGAPGSGNGGQVPTYTGVVLTPAQIVQFAAGAGFAGADLITAAAIALAESSGDPNAYGTGGQCCDYGLWQINSYWHPEFGPNFSMLYDPATNAAAAYSVYARAGNSFGPWKTYPAIYLKYVPIVQAALA